VIATGPLSQLVPMFAIRIDMPVTQFNNEVGRAGMPGQFELSLPKTLTVLADAVRLLKQRDIDLDPRRSRWTTRRNLRPLSRAEAVGIFQLEDRANCPRAARP